MVGIDFEGCDNEFEDVGVFLQVGCGKGLIAQIRVVVECKSELSVLEIGVWRGRMVQPLEQRAKGQQALIIGAHRLFIGRLGRWGRIALHISTSISCAEEDAAADIPSGLRGDTVGAVGRFEPVIVKPVAIKVVIDGQIFDGRDR